MEGWANDVTLLRRQAAAVDRRLHQMRLVDRLEGLFMHMQMTTGWLA